MARDAVQSEGKAFLNFLAEIADPEDLPLLVAACAGRCVHVPEAAPLPTFWIFLAIGREKGVRVWEQLRTRYTGDIDIPFNGVGIVTMLQKAIAKRILDGLAAGKGTAVLAAECGVTRRTIQMHKAKLRKEGRLPKVDTNTALRTEYFQGNLFRTNSPQLSSILQDHDSSEDSNLDVAFAEATAPVATKVLAGEPTRRERAIAIIVQLHGEAVCDAIRGACRGPLVSLHPRAIERTKHPFRAALDETESKLLAIRLIASGIGPAALNLGTRQRARIEKERLIIRQRLMRGEAPEQIAKDMDINPGTVFAQVRLLKGSGRLTHRVRSYASRTRAR